MATALRRPVSHEDRLSLTEHLDELRSRLVVCVLGLLAAFSFCFWQADNILEIVNKPLEQTQNLEGEGRSNDPLEQNARFQTRSGAAFRAQAAFYEQERRSFTALAVAADSGVERREFQRLATQAAAAERASRAAAAAEPTNKERQPVTLGVAEPFTTTISVSFYAALLIALPLLLYQLYAFVLPAFAPGERKIALPLMSMVPFLFFGGVAFGYFVVLPRAIGFLQNFNDDDFDILIQAREYYRFAVMFIGSIGLLFQIPIVVIAITRLGILTPRQLQKNWGYVLLALAILAAVATPTPDPLTMMLAMVPLFLLFELSILLSAWLNRVSPPGHWWGEDDDAQESFATAYDDED
jgi:sec-independent protein translocase protein TatC